MDDRHSFRRHLRLTLGLTAVLWIVWFCDVLFGLQLAQYGIIPHTAIGLRGILFSPFIHDTNGIGHILSNTLPFMVLFFVLISAYEQVAVFVLVCIHLLSGLLVWMYAPPYTVHIGISGIIYGIAAFLVGSGFFRRDLTSIGIAVFVSILYGGMAEGFIRQPGISWQSHVFGAAIGLLMSFILRSYHQRPSPFEEEEPDDDRHFFEKHP